MRSASSFLTAGPATRSSSLKQPPRLANCANSRGAAKAQSTSTSSSISIWPSPLSRRAVRAFSTAEPAAEQETATTSSSCRARSTLTGPDLEAWESASAHVAEQLSIEGSEADDFLEIAFGWGRSTYWRGSVDEATPDVEVVSSAIAFLKEDLSMTSDEALAVLRSFPETLNLDVEKQLRGNLALLAKEYKIEGAAAKACVRRTPRFLGMTLNCYGDCVGLCDRCLVRF